jgi:hypothetical protein
MKDKLRGIGPGIQKILGNPSPLLITNVFSRRPPPGWLHRDNGEDTE